MTLGEHPTLSPPFPTLGSCYLHTCACSLSEGLCIPHGPWPGVTGNSQAPSRVVSGKNGDLCYYHRACLSAGSDSHHPHRDLPSISSLHLPSYLLTHPPTIHFFNHPPIHLLAHLPTIHLLTYKGPLTIIQPQEKWAWSREIINQYTHLIESIEMSALSLIVLCPPDQCLY